MRIIFLVLAIAVITSCKSESGDEKSTETNDTSSTVDAKQEVNNEGFMDFTVNDTLAARIWNHLKTENFGNDVGLMSKNDKKFQMAQVDLNDDGAKEVFVSFTSPYFCGSGGCTIYLLDDSMQQITKFTVIRPPLFVQKEKVNGWKTILVKSEGEFRKLMYENGSYPPNPTVANTVDYAPSGHDLVLFDEQFSPSKTYSFE